MEASELGHDGAHTLAQAEGILDVDLQHFLDVHCQQARATIQPELLQHKLQSFKAIFARYRDDLVASPEKAFSRMAEDLPSLHDTHRRMLLHEAKDRAMQAAVLAVLASAGSVLHGAVAEQQRSPGCAPPQLDRTAAAADDEEMWALVAAHGLALLQAVADRAARAVGIVAAVGKGGPVPSSEPRPEQPRSTALPESASAAAGAGTAEAADGVDLPPLAADAQLPQPAADLQNAAPADHDAHAPPLASAASGPPPPSLPPTTTAAAAAPEPGSEQPSRSEPVVATEADAVAALAGVEGLLLLARPGARPPGAVASTSGTAAAGPEHGAAALATAPDAPPPGDAAARPDGQGGGALHPGLGLPGVALAAADPLQHPVGLPLQLLPGPFAPGALLAGQLPLPDGAPMAVGLPAVDGAAGAGAELLQQPLAGEQLTVLEAQEQMVKNISVQHFMQEADALLQISELRLFEAAGFSSFSEYITKSGRLRIQLRQARHLVAAARFIRSLPPDVPRPRNERQVRPLTGQPPDIALAAWRLALARAQAKGEGVCNRITAECVAEVLEQMDAAGLPRPHSRRGRGAGKSPARGRARDESDSDAQA